MNTADHRFLSVLFLVCLLSALARGQGVVGAAHIGDPSSNSGIALDSIPDLDGDGLSDIVVGANFTGTNFLSAGSISVLSGKDLSTILQIDGVFQSQQLGRAVAGVEDLSGDGIPDIVGGSIFRDSTGLNGPGHVAVFSGADGSLLYAVDGTAVNGRFGSKIVSLGDVDSDNLGDFAVSAPEAFMSDGQVKIISGATGAVLHTLNGSTFARLGWDLDSAGDQDGDGKDDVLICAPTEAGVGGLVMAGRVRIISSATGNLIREFTGSPTQEAFGLNAAGLSDLNGDGVHEYAVGTPTFGSGGLSNQGRLFVYDGMTGNLLYSVDGGTGGTNLADNIAGIDDWNGDGTDDFVASAVKLQVTPTARTLRVLSGVDGSVLGTVIGPGGALFSSFGSQVAALGDVNGDGREEFASSNPNIAITGTNGISGGGLTQLFLAPGPVLRRVHSLGYLHRLDLRWLPDNGDLFATSGDVVCDGATPGGLGAVVASLDQQEVVFYNYFPVLVSLDPAFVGYQATFGFDAAGSLLGMNLTRRYPVLAGLKLHMQVFELAPVAASSNALVFELLP